LKPVEFAGDSLTRLRDFPQPRGKRRAISWIVFSVA
jgi:hypothetical protein